MLTKRSVSSVVILTIITCGIYGVWWSWVTCKALQEEGRKTRIPPVLTTLAMLFYSSIGGVLLALDADDNLNAIKEARGKQPGGDFILWLILGAFIPVVTMALVQHEVNQLVDEDFPRV